MRECSYSNSHAQWIARIEHQLALDVHDSRYLNAAFEDAADDAVLSPGLPFADFAVRVKARQFRAGPRAAGRTIVGFPGTEHEIFAVHAGKLRRAKQFDMVNLFAVSAGDAVIAKRLSNCPGEQREFVDILKGQFHAVISH